MEPLDFEVKKTTEQFLKNYSKHDLAKKVIEEIMRKRHINIVPVGEDRRHKREWESGEDRPDGLLEKEGKRLALIDWKGHMTKEWMLNERAYYSYIAYSERQGLLMYCIWLLIPRRQLFYARLPFKKPIRKLMRHDMNWIIAAEEREVHTISELFRELGIDPKQLPLL